MAVPDVANAYTLQSDVTVDFSAVAGGTVVEESFTVNGLKTSQVIVVNKHGSDAGLFLLDYRITAADTIGISMYNPTASSINAASQTFKVVAL
jgi:hypothetical protein